MVTLDVARWLIALLVGVGFWTMVSGPAGRGEPIGEIVQARDAPAPSDTDRPRDSPTRRHVPAPRPPGVEELIGDMDPGDMDDMLRRCTTLLYRGEAGFDAIVELVRRAEAAGHLPVHTLYFDEHLLVGEALAQIRTHADALLRFGLYLHGRADKTLPDNLRRLRRRLEQGLFAVLLAHARPTDPELLEGYTDVFADLLRDGWRGSGVLHALAQIPTHRATALIADRYGHPGEHNAVIRALYLRGATGTLRSLLDQTDSPRLAQLIQHAIAHPRSHPYPRLD